MVELDQLNHQRISKGKRIKTQKNIGEKKGNSIEREQNNVLKVFYVNARSLINKMDEIQLYAYEIDPDIICVQETWATEKITNAELHINNYNIFRNDRKHKKGGGCLIYMKEKLHASPIEHLSENSETLWCKIRTEEGMMIIGVCYNSPSANKADEDVLHRVLKKTCEAYENCSIIIVGDFNHGSINWDRMTANAEDEAFMEITQDLFLSQHVQDPTRGDRILDLTLSNKPEIICELKVGEQFSDHNIITFNIIVKTETVTNKELIYDYARGNYNEFKRHLRNIDWSHEFKDQDVNSQYEFLKQTMNEATKLYIPTKQRRKANRRPIWMTGKADRARKKKYKLWKRYTGTKQYEDYVEYKKHLNKARKACRKAKKEFEMKLAKNIKLDPKSYFNYVNSKRKVKESVGPLLSDGEEISDDEEMAKVLNNYFRSVYTKEDDSNVPNATEIFNGTKDEELNNIQITEEMVEEKIKNLKSNKAAGPDQMHSNILKELSDELVKPLTIIFKHSLETSEIPYDWKIANVAPIYKKKGSKNQSTNYRPVSLTSQVCKMMESIIRDSILRHLEKYHLIKESQHGFTNRKSCLTNLLTFMDDITKMTDLGNSVDILYLDFSKAFDTVPHKRLVHKLKMHGITGKISDWITGWLTGRRQRVKLNGRYSDWCSVSSGVPQGSVLGPTLFIIYLNDLEETTSSNMLKFADDAKIYRQVNNDSDAQALQEDMNTLQKWAKKWKMTFNADKCKCMHIGKNNRKYSYNIGATKMEETEEEKDLGVLISNNLKVSKQCEHASKRANQAAGIIKRTIVNREENIMMNLYKTLVRPHLEYCSQVWSPHYKADVRRIEAVQRRFTKLIKGCRSLTYEERLKKLQLNTLEYRRDRCDQIETFKIMKDLSKVNKHSIFERNTSTRTRGHNLKLTKQRVKTDIRKFTFSQRVVNQWNALTSDAIESKTINEFKGHLRRLLPRTTGDKHRLPDLLSRQTPPNN